jgi:hypothetical protein
MDSLNQFIETNRILRSINAKCHDTIDTINSDGIDAGRAIIGYIRRDFRALQRIWPNLNSPHLRKLEELVAQDNDNVRNWWQIIDQVIPFLEDELDDFYSSASSGSATSGQLSYYFRV